MSLRNLIVEFRPESEIPEEGIHLLVCIECNVVKAPFRYARNDLPQPLSFLRDIHRIGFSSKVRRNPGAAKLQEQVANIPS